MKPSTKQEREVVELSAKLPPLTSADWRYIETAGSRHIALYNGKRVKCTDCGHEWRQDGLNKQVRCPNCGTKLNIEETKCRKKSELVYDVIIQARHGWQVCRYYRVQWSCPVDGGRTLQVDEVVQRWVNAKGKVIVMARKRYMSMYLDSFVLGEPMSIKRDGDYGAYHLPYWGVIVKSVIPILRRNGFKQNLYGMRPSELFQQLLTNPFAETLYKAGHGYLLRELCSRARLDDKDYIAAAKICVRKDYRMKMNEVVLWIDMVQNLLQLGKDVHNSHYVCPADLKQAHDKAVHQCIRKRERERAAAAAEELRKNKKLARSYVKRMKKFFGLVFTDGKISIHVLKNVAEFEAEGNAMHHCVFANRYFAKPDSLVMSARVDGERQETIEVNLKRLQLIQSRGVNNSNSEYHDEIVQLVNANMAMIAKIARVK